MAEPELLLPSIVFLESALMAPFQFASQRVRTQRERGERERERSGKKDLAKRHLFFRRSVPSGLHRCASQATNKRLCLPLSKILPLSEILPLISHSLSKVLSLGCSATTNPTTSSAPQCCTVLCSDPFRNIPFACSIHQWPAPLSLFEGCKWVHID